MSDNLYRDGQVPSMEDWAQVKREHAEAQRAEELQKRQYRAEAMDYATRMCAGQYPSMSPAGLERIVLDAARTYFEFIWNGR